MILQGLRGVTDAPHVALTYDDGPDGGSTPHVLDVLDRHGVRATFFVLGAYAARERHLLRRMVGDGHELAIHGWTHRCTAAVPPRRLREQVRASKELVEDLTGQQLRWYRPPYGVLVPGVRGAAGAAGLETVLWSAWGRDWEARATPERVVRTVRRTLRPGGTILLHDSDRTSAPGSWRTTVAATELLLKSREVPYGPLRDHVARPHPALAPVVP